MIKTKELLKGLAQRLKESPYFREAYFYYKGYIVALHKYGLITDDTIEKAYSILEEAWKIRGDTCVLCKHKLCDYINSYDSRLCPHEVL